MSTKGVFGYIIGKKKRLMKVSDDADLLWQLSTREIFLLMNKYKTKEALQEAFSQIKVIKYDKKPKFTKEEAERIKYFNDYELEDNNLRFCEASYINILEAGYIIKEPEEYGYIFILDFNKGEVRYYKKEIDGKINQLNSATIEEIMTFEDMPTINHEELLTNMKSKFEIFFENYKKVTQELDKLYKIKQNAKAQGAANIEEKVDKLIYDMKIEEKKLHLGRRVFYNRLKDLDLLEEE
jgi:hypothetical protein